MNTSLKTIFVATLALYLFGAGCATTQTVPSKPNSAVLDLHGQNLTAIPASVFAKTELTTLNLSYNRLTQAPPSQIGQLVNLTSLDLSYNQLTGLPAELGRLQKLETLNVSYNKLTGLPMELGNLTNLRVLDLTGNTYSKQDLDAIAKKLPKTIIRR